MSDNIPKTRFVVKEMYLDARKKRMAAEVRLKNALKIENNLKESVDELGIWSDEQ